MAHGLKEALKALNAFSSVSLKPTYGLITEKSSSPSDLRDERNRRVEFSTPAFNLLNALEQIGYKVVTSSSFVTGPKKFDTKDYIWTLYRPSCEMEM